MLSDIKIKRYGIPKLKATEFQVLVPGREVWEMSVIIPIAMSMTLVQSVTASSWRTWMCTHRGKVHEAGERNSPKLHGVDHVATIELWVGVNVTKAPAARVVWPST